eukprot:8713618-Pyramimonas_sp.AAC.1
MGWLSSLGSVLGSDGPQGGCSRGSSSDSQGPRGLPRLAHGCPMLDISGAGRGDGAHQRGPPG